MLIVLPGQSIICRHAQLLIHLSSELGSGPSWPKHGNSPIIGSLNLSGLLYHTILLNCIFTHCVLVQSGYITTSALSIVVSAEDNNATIECRAASNATSGGQESAVAAIATITVYCKCINIDLS